MLEVSAKSTKALAMTAVRYQLFLLDPTAEKPNMLLAVDPPFNFPSAVDQIMKTSKFEKLQGLVVIGLDPQIEKFLKEVERKDVTDWLDCDCQQRLEELKKLALEHELDVSEKALREPDSEEIVYGEEEEVVAKTAYPHDLPEANRELWDAIPKGADFKLGWSIVKKRIKEIIEEHKVLGARKKKKENKKEYPKNLPRGNEDIWDKVPSIRTDKFDQAALNHKEKNIRMAVHANFYEIYCAKLGVVPWHHTSSTEMLDARLGLKGFIIQGEEAAHKVMTELVDHLTHAGLIFKKRALQAPCISRHLATNKYEMSWLMPVTLKPEKGHSWLNIASFIKREFSKKYAFNERDSKRKLVTSFQKGTVLTELVVERHDEKTINLYINHYLDEGQAALLTDLPLESREKIERTMLSYCNQWKKSGKFPKLHAEDF
jgi:hypothetical protein